MNRQCSSGLRAVADGAASIKAGFYDIGKFMPFLYLSLNFPVQHATHAGIGVGLKSMTANSANWEGSIDPKVNTCQQAQDCLLSLEITSENVAHRYGVTQQEQDQAAVESHRWAGAATASCKFKEEIIPDTTKEKKNK